MEIRHRRSVPEHVNVVIDGVEQVLDDRGRWRLAEKACIGQLLSAECELPTAHRWYSKEDQ